MIINNEHKFAYLGMTKTASTSLHQVFKRVPGSINPQIRTKKGISTYRSHGRIVPKCAKNYDKIVSIRNPYDRVASMYNLVITRGTPKVPCDSFEEFVDFILHCLYIDKGMDLKDYKYRWLPIWKYIEPINNIKHIIKFENLNADIHKISLLDKVIVPHLNRHKKYKRFEELNSPEIIKKVNEWAGPDFEMFDYKKIT